jgi:hypothetical protein
VNTTFLTEEGLLSPELTHCFDKIGGILRKRISLPPHKSGELCVTRNDSTPLPPRDILQIGYNLGRIAEITGMGREVWDRFKGHIEAGEHGGALLTLYIINNNLTGLSKDDPNPKEDD